MTNPNNTNNKITIDSAHEELDLPSVMKILWERKLIVIVFSFLIAVIAAIYAFNAQQWWSSYAVVTTPKVTDMAPFRQAAKRLQPAFDTYLSNGDIKSGKELDELTDQNELFKRFIETFNSADNKREFFTNNKDFSEISQKRKVSENEGDVAYQSEITSWIEKVNANAKNKNHPNKYTFRFESKTAESSLNLLNQYIEYTNKIVNKEYIEDLYSIVDIKRNELEQQLKTRMSLVDEILKVEIEKSQWSLRIAKAANVTKPVDIKQDQELFPINLGTDAISEKIKVLNELKDLSLIDVNIGKIESKIKTLKQEVTDVKEFQSFSYLEKPQIPMNKDKPRKGAIIILGIFIGLLIGMAFALLTDYLGKLRKI
ncbi:LPS O-antigen chain length determinant protein WzzB [Enterovibrio calviensis]|uniref:LPS O-antigen chain length determinant protein WzzB n=1 Tax=Enterovibrio calviensis TaxID=91359 RepID=UPI0037365B77